MFIPRFTDKAQGLMWVSTQIGIATDTWHAYAEEASADYAWAWEHQGTVLKDVHDRILTRMKAEEANALFVLNLLTVGVGSALAGSCVKSIIGKTMEEKFIEKAADLASEKIKEPIKKGNEWIAKHLGSDPSEDAFKPPGMTPAEYGPRLKKGVYSRGKLLKKLLSDVLSNPAGVTLQGVQNLADLVCNSDFVNHPPPELDDGQLKTPSLLGLWLSWAWGRDVAYWEVRSGGPSAFAKINAENLDFEPVRQDLKKLGVPLNQISQYGGLILDKRRPDDNKVMDMYGFITWANSMDVVNLLFRDSDVSTEMQKKIQYQLMLRRMIPPQYRVTAEA